jgi:hypothetical protein
MAADPTRAMATVETTIPVISPFKRGATLNIQAGCPQCATARRSSALSDRAEGGLPACALSCLLAQAAQEFKTEVWRMYAVSQR